MLKIESKTPTVNCLGKKQTHSKQCLCSDIANLIISEADLLHLLVVLQSVHQCLADWNRIASPSQTFGDIRECLQLQSRNRQKATELCCSKGALAPKLVMRFPHSSIDSIVLFLRNISAKACLYFSLGIVSKAQQQPIKNNKETNSACAPTSPILLFSRSIDFTCLFSFKASAKAWLIRIKTGPLPRRRRKGGAFTSRSPRSCSSIAVTARFSVKSRFAKFCEASGGRKHW